MTIKQPFAPDLGSTQQLTAAAASANVGVRMDARQVRIWNSGITNKVYVRTYSSVAATDKASLASATVADHVVPPNTITTISKPLNHDRFAYISASGTTLEIATGEGF